MAANDKPISFFKFVLIATIVLRFFQMRYLKDSIGMGMTVTAGIVAYLAYRYGRVQPWWPFSTGSVSKWAQQKAVDRQTSARDTHRQVAKPLKQGYKKPKAKNVEVITERYDPAASPFRTTDVDHLSAKEFAASKLSNVGVRGRVVRFKVQRSKALRSKSIRVKRRAVAIEK